MQNKVILRVSSISGLLLVTSYFLVSNLLLLFILTFIFSSLCILSYVTNLVHIWTQHKALKSKVLNTFLILIFSILVLPIFTEKNLINNSKFFQNFGSRVYKIYTYWMAVYLMLAIIIFVLNFVVPGYEETFTLNHLQILLISQLAIDMISFLQNSWIVDLSLMMTCLSILMIKFPNLENKLFLYCMLVPISSLLFIMLFPLMLL